MHNHSSVHTQPCTPGCTHALERKGEGEEEAAHSGAIHAVGYYCPLITN